jgi:hypothetical protein
MTADKRYIDQAEDALTDLQGILHALNIIRFGDAINKPGPELHALNVLIPMAVTKAEELRQAMEDDARTRKATVPAQGATPQ